MRSEVIKLLEKQTKLSKQELESLIEIPPSDDLGDYAFPCFSLAKIFKKHPIEISKQLAKEIKPTKEIEKIISAGPYLNFFTNKKILAENTISSVLAQKEKYGKNNSNKNKLMIEFSQPNTHKAFHVGHIRGTSLGESIARIAEANGNKVVRANYSGDTGMHIAKWIWCYQKFHKNEKLQDAESWIASIYVDAVKRLEGNEELESEVAEINKKLDESKDKALIDLWKKTRQLSIKSWEKIYKELNTKFDVHYFESEMEKPAKEISNSLVQEGIAEINDKATIINLEKYNLSVWVLLRSDGTVLYSAKDLALAVKKFKDYKLDQSLILLGHAQKLHSLQLIKTLELMKFQNAKDYEAMTFAEVRLPTGKMSSRTGENILYSDFIKELKSYASKEIKSRSPKVSEKEIEQRALTIAIAAIKYSMLKQDANKTLTFIKEDALNFDGNTGPYLLYSYARAKSILRKISKKISSKKISELKTQEIKLVKQLASFPEITKQSFQNKNPALIANYSYDLAKLFNEFYHACPVINSENEKFRIQLTEAFAQTLKNSLNLLGINTLEEM